jgi:hypothetical protein
MNKDKIDIDSLPEGATRSEWSRILGIPIRKLVYEETKGRLKRMKTPGYPPVLGWKNSRQAALTKSVR